MSLCVIKTWSSSAREVHLKILLAIDNSKFSEATTQALIAQARPKETEVRVLHVIEIYPLFSAGKQPAPELALASEEHRHYADALVARTSKALRDAGFDRVTTAVEQGDPKIVVLDSAEEWKADLILLGSHGEKDWTRFPMGSVSEAVVRHAQCSVQVVRIRPGL
jgi:nucleotide-binding universal stress UspA family protein